MTRLSERTWYRAFACTLIMIASIGILYGIYPPLLPAMLEQGWLTKSEAGFIASLKALGTLAGAFACITIGKKFNLGIAARVFLVIGLVSLALSAIKFGPIWLGINRFAAGFSIAGAGMTAAALITQGAPSQQRGKLISLICLGSGIGTIMVAMTLPLPEINIKASATNGWLYATILYAVCIGIAWPGLRTRSGSKEFPEKKRARSMHRKRLILLSLSYGTQTIACTPILIYLSAYIQHEHKTTLAFSSMAYAVAGLGVACGGFICNYIFVWLLGRYASLIITLAVGLGAALLILFTDSLRIDLLASFMIALTHSGSSALKTHGILELAGPAGEIVWLKIYKVVASVSFAIGGSICGFLLAGQLGYKSLFIMSAIAFGIGVVLSFFITLPKPVHVSINDATQ